MSLQCQTTVLTYPLTGPHSTFILEGDPFGRHTGTSPADPHSFPYSSLLPLHLHLLSIRAFSQQSHTKQRDMRTAPLANIRPRAVSVLPFESKFLKSSYSSNSCPSSLFQSPSPMHLPSTLPRKFSATHGSRMLSSKASLPLTACLNYAQLMLPSLYPSLSFWDSVSWIFFFLLVVTFAHFPLQFPPPTQTLNPECSKSHSCSLCFSVSSVMV